MQVEFIYMARHVADFLSQGHHQDDSSDSSKRIIEIYIDNGHNIEDEVAYVVDSFYYYPRALC